MIPLRELRSYLTPIILMLAVAAAAIGLALFLPLTGGPTSLLLVGFSIFVFAAFTVMAMSFVDLRNLRIARQETSVQLDQFQSVLSTRLDNNLRDDGLIHVGNYLRGIMRESTEWRLWLRLPPDLMRDSRAGMTFFSIGEPPQSPAWAPAAEQEFRQWSMYENPERRPWEKRLPQYRVLLVGTYLPHGAIATGFYFPRSWPSPVRVQTISIALTQMGHFLMGLRAQVIEARRLVDSENYGHVVSIVVHELAREQQVMIERLKNLAVSDQEPETMAPVFRSLQRSAACLEWVRQWKQVEQDVFHVTPRPMSVLPILEDLEKSIRLAWPELGYSMRGALDTVIIGDPQLISVLQNLVFNAAEAGPEDGKVSLEVVEEGHNVTIYIADEGPGIRQGNEDRIFEALVSDSNGKRDGRSGTGIGLFLSRRIAQSLGGYVEYCGPARSTEGGRSPGSRFAVRLLRAKEIA